MIVVQHSHSDAMAVVQSQRCNGRRAAQPRWCNGCTTRRSRRFILRYTASRTLAPAPHNAQPVAYTVKFYIQCVSMQLLIKNTSARAGFLRCFVITTIMHAVEHDVLSVQP